MKKVAVIDYGMGNLRSVSKAIEHVGVDVRVTDNPSDIKNSHAVVLPGVGAFKDAVSNLKNKGLWELIIGEIKSGKPFLGICLGLQLLLEKSHEFGETKGLGLIKGTVVKFNLDRNYKIPHMGWNQIWKQKESSILSGISDGSFFYFVHSYHVVCEESDAILTKTDYGIDFVSSIQKNNIVATQFHPEKSQKLGLKFLYNFFKEYSII